MDSETKPSNNDISPEVLDFMGITPEDVARFDSERKAREKILAVCKQTGKDQYLQARTRRGNRTIWGFLQKGIIPITWTNLSEVPDALIAFGQEIRMERGYKEELMHFIGGIADGATEEGDWQTAVNAFDVISPGGILHNQTAQEKLRAQAQADRMSATDIARAIQGRITSRGLSATNIPPSSPSPQA